MSAEAPAAEAAAAEPAPPAGGANKNLLDVAVTTKETEYGVASFPTKGHHVSWAATSMQGRRKNQEDEHSVMMNCNGEDYHFMMVCDGHGGKFASAKVKELMAPHIAENHKINMNESHNKRYKAFTNALAKSFVEVDKKLLETPEVKEGKDASGTTVCAAFVASREVVVANCGDTRAVFSKSKKAVDLSTDHKPNLMAETERITKAGGFVAHNRVQGLHGVARSLGDFGYKQWGACKVDEQLVTCKPETLVFPVDVQGEEDEFLLIACDGVWDVMKSQDAVDFVHAQLSPDKGKDRATNLGTVVDRLLDRCLELGSLDNMTAAIIAFPKLCRENDYFRDKKKSGVCSIM
jgi:serine/threonine protein phosphatase PrpC